MNDVLTTATGKIPPLKIDWSTFLRKMIIFCGETGTGKSVAMDEVLNALSQVVPWFIVFSPTSKQDKNSLAMRTHKILRYEAVKLECLRRIYKRQKDVSEIYRAVSEANFLKTMYSKVKNTRYDRCLYALRTDRKRILKDPDISDDDKKILCKEIDQSTARTYKRRLGEVAALYYNDLRKLAKKFGSMKNAKLVTHALVNPHICLILDDCAASIKEWGESKVIKELFYQGRHNNCTSLISLQSDSDLVSRLRRNAMIRYFTCQEVAVPHFTNARNNGYTSQQAKFVKNEAIPRIFQSTEKKEKYYKLVYVRGANPPIMYVNSKTYPGKKCFGGKMIIKICNAIPSKGGKNGFGGNNLMT